jgi:Fe-S cluster biosynthesis and repair protein YggX
MKKFTLVIVLFSILQITNGQTRYQKLMGGNGYNEFYSLVKTSNGYIMVGVTNSHGAGQKDILAVRTNFNGDTLWTKTYGGFYNEEAFAVKSTSDGNFIIAGYTSSFSNFSNDSANFYVLKINSNGNLLWAKSFGGPGIDIAKSIIETTNHNYLITGSTNSIGAGCNDVYLLELDSSGSYLWSKSLGATGCDFASDLIELGDGGFLITGNTSSFSLGGYVVFILKTDSVGDYQWTKTYDFTGSFSPKLFTANEIVRGYTNDFLIVGTRGLGFVGDSQHYLLDVDSSGSLNWAKTYLMNSGNSEGFSIDKTTSGGFIVGGWMGNYYPALLKVDAIGQFVWSYVYSSPTASFYEGKGFKTVTANDGGYFTAGMRYDTGDTSALLLKTDFNGDITCPYTPPTSNAVNVLTMNIASQTFTSSLANLNLIDTCVVNSSPNNFITYCFTVGINEIANSIAKECFPNPFNDKLSFAINDNELSEIIIYDIASRKLLQQKFTNFVSLNTEQLAKGIYIYEVRNRSGSCKKGKVVKD